MTQKFATDEDKMAFEKAHEIFYHHATEADNPEQVIYHLWRLCNESLLERLADTPHAGIRPDRRFSPLVMIRELLDDIETFTWN
jgi:hypothetical protein